MVQYGASASRLMVDCMQLAVRMGLSKCGRIVMVLLVYGAQKGMHEKQVSQELHVVHRTAR
jgi:hypothetical protein